MADDMKKGESRIIGADSGHRPRAGRGWSIVTVPFLLAACGAGGGEARTDDLLTVSAEAVHVLATPDVAARVTDVQPANDGRVWVLNSIEPYFVVLGPTGVERAFGRGGGGPEEFGAPVALMRGPDPTDVWTYDVVRHALIRVSGEERRDVPLPRDSLPPSRLVSFEGGGLRPAPPWREAANGGFLLARARAGTPPGSALAFWNADILFVRTAASDVTLEVRVPIADRLGDPASRYADATLFLPYPLWTVCADGTLGLYDPLENELRRATRDGRPLASIALPEEQRLPVTADRMIGLFYRLMQDAPAGQRPDSAEMRRRLEAQFDEFASRSAGVFPEYVDLRCAADGTLWLQRYDVDVGRLGRGPDWYRISTDGSRTRVALPDGFTAFRFEAGRVWGTLQDELGVVSVGWIDTDALQ